MSITGAGNNPAAQNISLRQNVARLPPPERSAPVNNDIPNGPPSFERKDGIVKVPLFKTYNMDGKSEIFYVSKAPESNTPSKNALQRTAPPSAANLPVTAAPAAMKDNVGGGGENKNSGKQSSALKQDSGGCKSCESRVYKDRSDDPGVSFKLGGHVDSKASFAAVSSHESEHETREAQSARDNGEEVVYSRVRVHMSQCPECKKMYSSGGETEVVKAKDESKQSVIMDLLRPPGTAYEDKNAGLSLNVRM